MVRYSNDCDPHTGTDVGDALPWVGRVPEHDATIESQQNTSRLVPADLDVSIASAVCQVYDLGMQRRSRALPARGSYNPLTWGKSPPS